MDLHRIDVSARHGRLTGPSARDELTAATARHVYPVPEHYIVYEPPGERFIVVVAVVRQGRDIPAIMRKWAVPIRRELTEIRVRIARREISLPGRPPRRRGKARCKHSKR